MIQTVIFDMDGVIIDSEPVYFEIDKQMFEELNIHVSFEEYCTYVGASSQNMWDTIIRKHGLPGSSDELMKKEHSRYMKHIASENGLRAIQGIEELIKKLHANDFKMAIASSSRMEVIDLVLKKFDLSDFFSAKISGAELKHSKPHPEIFLRSAQLLNAEPGTCVVIEDSENGVIAAKAAGMKCIGFFNANSGAQELGKADVVVKSFEGLDVDFIRNL
jgi:HAD superfamily hydrolase (TIGR01509 family)